MEHPVTEYVGQVDLVEEMLRVAAKQPISAHLSTEQASKNIHGWALEARVYAEDPLRSFLPSNGSLLTLVEPDGATAFESLGGTPVRVDRSNEGKKRKKRKKSSKHQQQQVSKLKIE